uniref:Uncharacterized protein n=1 Tax=Rhizophagus irregularis (strain DAOM 181602 / DAOM 197198 / MUCL 43194) TaxID=747089 RepID=U9UP33_RHIID
MVVMENVSYPKNVVVWEAPEDAFVLLYAKINFPDINIDFDFDYSLFFLKKKSCNDEYFFFIFINNLKRINYTSKHLFEA